MRAHKKSARTRSADESTSRNSSLGGGDSSSKFQKVVEDSSRPQTLLIKKGSDASRGDTTDGGVPTPASGNKEKNLEGKCYDISAIMSGRGVFRVGGSFKGEITKTKEEDSYIGADEENEEDTSISEVPDIEEPKPPTTSSREIFNLQYPPKYRIQRTFSSGNNSELSKSQLRDSYIVTVAPISRAIQGQDNSWCEFMAADWFAEVGINREDDDDSSVVTEGGQDSNIFKNAVKSCFCTPWRVPAAHM